SQRHRWPQAREQVDEIRGGVSGGVYTCVLADIADRTETSPRFPNNGRSDRRNRAAIDNTQHVEHRRRPHRGRKPRRGGSPHPHERDIGGSVARRIGETRRERVTRRSQRATRCFRKVFLGLDEPCGEVSSPKTARTSSRSERTEG